MTKYYTTLDGIKRAATKLKRRTGVGHCQALDQIARDAGYRDFFSASKAYATASAESLRYPVTIFEFWSNRPAGTRGNESRTFLLDKPLSDLVKPHHLTGYLSCAKFSGENTLKHQHDLNIAESEAKAPELSGDYRSIDISRRWDIANEFTTMRKIVDVMPDLVRARVEAMWCDSNARAYYSFTVVPGNWYDCIEFDIRDAVRAATSGFNGLSIEGGGNNRMFDPEWRGDDYDYSGGAFGEPSQQGADWL